MRSIEPPHIHLSQFDGPLDLLLHLIDEAQIDIKDIFISQITEQYLSLMSQAGSLDMDQASAFLTMAATLLEIKSRALLPRPPEPEPDADETQLALIAQLEAHRALKLNAETLKAREDETGGAFYKLPEEFLLGDPEVEWSNLTLEALTEAWLRLTKRAEERDDIAERLNAPKRILPRDTITVEAFMERIERRLLLGECAFHKLFGVPLHKPVLVAGFMALLELMKLGRALVRQDTTFGIIMISLPSDTAKPQPIAAQTA